MRFDKRCSSNGTSSASVFERPNIYRSKNSELCQFFPAPDRLVSGGGGPQPDFSSFALCSPLDFGSATMSAWTALRLYSPISLTRRLEPIAGLHRCEGDGKDAELRCNECGAVVGVVQIEFSGI